MFLECQDVVSESCPSQFDSQSSSMINSELPCLPVGATVDFSCNNDGPSWLQRFYIQRDEAEPARRTCREWKNRNSKSFKTRPSASAMVLARKRKRNEQRKLMDGKKQAIDSGGSDDNTAEGERDSLDMEEQLTAFVEYDATDLDSLDINPSQDFDGDVEEDTVTEASQHMQLRNWEDVTDVDQFQDEASECFDNVIYAPRISSAGSTFIEGKREFSRPFFLQNATAIPEYGSLTDDSEGSLSDGFDIAINFASTVQPAVQPAIISMNGSSTSPNVAFKAQWRQRRSVKRDCSLIDNSSNYFVNGRLLLEAPPSPVTTSESSSDRVIELKNGCFDSSDDAHTVYMGRNDMSCSVLSSLPETTHTTTVSSLNDPSSLPIGFQSQLARKRRKVDQLTLDGFFRPKKHGVH